jgi:hypothetical protein
VDEEEGITGASGGGGGESDSGRWRHWWQVIGIWKSGNFELTSSLQYFYKLEEYRISLCRDLNYIKN